MKISNKMTGEELAAARRGFGLSQVDFARLIGRSPTAVTRYETGENVVPKSIALLVRLIERVGLDEVEGVDA
jgi:DNA-binding transcriptional regulator YiaG